MRRILLIVTALLLLSGCKKEEKDWLVGIWNLANCRVISTGYEIPTNIKSWEFEEGGVMYENTKHSSERHRYTHPSGKIVLDESVTYIITAARTDMFEAKPDGSDQAYTFKRPSTR